MTRSSLSWLAACAACFTLGVLLGGGPTAAHALDLPEPAWLCRTFPHPLDAGAPVDTSDRTSELGRWVGEEAAGGWKVRQVELALVHKPSGTAQGYAHVCLAR